MFVFRSHVSHSMSRIKNQGLVKRRNGTRSGICVTSECRRKTVFPVDGSYIPGTKVAVNKP